MDNKTNKMLIDATHPEETRVVVLRNGRVEEFDYESAARKLLRGNIYLAKVTRVEPSLQAAFVEYGGNRHGFLAFNEIHPDYYQIPVSDRQALIDEEAAAEAEADAEADARAERKFQGNGGGRRRDGGRDGGRNGGRDGGRNGHRHSNQGTAADAGVQPAGTGDQPGAPLDLRQEATHEDHHALDAQPHDTQGSVGVEHAGHEHSAHEHSGQQHPGHDHPDHTGTAAHQDASPAVTEQQHSTQTEATGHRADSVSESYAPDDRAAAHDDAALPARDDQHVTTHGDHSADAEHAHQESQVEGTDVAPRHEDRAGVDHIEEVPEITEAPETIGAGADAGIEDDVGEDVQERPRRQRRRQYKIQEVIKRRQVILVQVVKEERGNKGAALTTYLSLAGRYTVLMPNTGRGGGISRKIVNPGDRKRLKAIAQELDVPEGMGLIIRTAGAARTSQEIKRDYEYLLRLWESVRDMTLQSTAPSLVYEEGNLIKRSIRDLYTKEIDEVVVAGDQAYHDAHDFMRMLMPSHAKNVIRYTQPEALFTRYPIERQLNAMFSPYVTLKSGGYLVINQTEALVSIDVNSGKSTREYSIEETALATNLEASDEIARQLKLRDLAGLIVIDFIDMEEKRNNRKVEHRLTDALRFDRARIQVGRISHFGLMEMSRQRMRTGVLEGSTSQCPHCQGTGMIRSVESVALAVLRGLEDHLVKDPRSSVNVMTTATVALYILNNKRSFITDIERRYGIVVAVQASDRMQGANFAVERSTAPVVAPRQADRAAVSMDWGFDGDEAQEQDNQHDRDARGQENLIEVVDEGEGNGEGDEPEARGESGDANRPGRRRRRRRGRDRGDRPQHGVNGQQPAVREQREPGGEPPAADHAEYANDDAHPSGHAPEFVDEAMDADAGDAAEDAATGATQSAAAGEDGDRGARRGRRRGRRGGRRGREQRDGVTGEIVTPDEAAVDQQSAGDALETDAADVPTQSETAVHNAAMMDAHHDVAMRHAPDPQRETQDAHVAHQHAMAMASHTTDVPEQPLTPMAAPRESAPATVADASDAPVVQAERKPEPLQVTQFPEAPEDPNRPRRRGWWQRRGLGE